MFRKIILLIALIVAGPALAMSPVKDETKFRELISGKTLVIRLYTLRMQVRDDGTILGKAVGRKITGTWAWKGGYFCREMKWGSREIPYNCQLVSYDGKKIRFTVDKGAGDSADFSLQ